MVYLANFGIFGKWLFVDLQLYVARFHGIDKPFFHLMLALYDVSFDDVKHE